MTQIKLYNISKSTLKHIYTNIIPTNTLNELLNEKVNGKYKIINYNKITNNNPRYNVNSNDIEYYKHKRNDEISNQNTTKENLIRHYNEVRNRHNLVCEWNVFNTTGGQNYVTNLYDQTQLGAKSVMTCNHVYEEWNRNSTTFNTETMEVDINGDRWIDVYFAIDKIIRYSTDYLSRRVSKLYLDNNTGIMTYDIDYDEQ